MMEFKHFLSHNRPNAERHLKIESKYLTFEEKKGFRMISVRLLLHKCILGHHLWNIKATAVHV